jgi:probable HAF family extracellular repeat protein
MSRPLPVSLFATLLLLAGVAAAQVPSFQGLGDLPGGEVGSLARGISADGSVVIGESEGTAGSEAFRWTPAGGIAGLGFLPGGAAPSAARGASADGSVIVGASTDGGGVRRAFRWSAGVMTGLDAQSCSDCEPVTEGWGVSLDGLVVVGSSLARSGGTAPLHLDPVRWPGGGTALFDLGNLPGSEEAGEAFGASSDGSVIGGSHLTDDGAEAWVWTGSGLGALPALTTQSPRTAAVMAVSADGSTLVGYASKDTITLPSGTVSSADLQAVRWSGPGYATSLELGALPGAPVIDSRALATSADGALIVGRAVNTDADDRAFLWDAVGGMRDLKQVLVEEHGLDLTGWVLSEATGISDVVGGGFYVVGNGVNPQGESEGWIAHLVIPACRDGLDNDLDGPVDHPLDPGCSAPNDWSEELDCNDGLDNDGDGDVDFPADAGCRSGADPTERPDCSDGLDNDGDALVDLDDPGCRDGQGAREDPACSDSIDNDLDLASDHPADPECLGPWDASEEADCSDGLDNDGDGAIDHPADPECEAADDLSESPQCSDAIDNDGDGRTDYPAQYPDCVDPDDAIEAPQCGDGLDNDGDGFTDHPADTDCASPSDRSESPVDLREAGLLVVDRTSRTVFRVDVVTGQQTLISQAALLQAPQGIARRGGELVVADPAGLVAVAGSGAQALLTAPLLEHDSLQVVIDAAGVAYVLEADGIWTLAPGAGATTLWMAVPTPEPLPNLGQLDGDTLALEEAGFLLTTGLGFAGGGVFRVDPVTRVASPLVPGVLEKVRWLDLAAQEVGPILAAGFDFTLGAGVYQIDPVDGAVTPLNNSYPWRRPTGISLDASAGQIYVADAGVCADGACSGGEIVRVDPASGAVTPLTSGGFIAGELDVVYVPEPSRTALRLCGVLALALLGHGRARRRR